MNGLAATGFRPGRRDWLEAGGLALGLFVLYALTAPRTVATEDDGLFLLSSYFLGIEHPPGFPLYTLLGKLATLLPFGSVAYRVHLLSGLLGGLSCAALWLCARTLLAGRLPAYVAALGLGFSPAFWSQALIAEVYTFNTLFFLALLYLGLRAGVRTLPWMALLFGLSLSNHYPLMLLVAPAFAVLLWPLRTEIAMRFGLLSWLVIAGLLPYAWLIFHSWRALPVAFYGPLETLTEVWYFLSRAGYGEVDRSPTADWLDRLNFFGFLGAELLRQLAVVGTVLAAYGCWLQWRIWGARVAASLTVAFLMPSVVLLLLLGFDYNYLTKHVYHVYPLPAYAVAALWMALGLQGVLQRAPLGPRAAAGAAAALLALVFAVGARSNFLASYDWSARYGEVVLRSLPRDALLFVRGDADLAPIAYLHMVEGMRPDITIYNSKGLILGSRLFHPLRTSEAQQEAMVREFIEAATLPVVFASERPADRGWRDRWLYTELDKAVDPKRPIVEIPEELVQFFERSVAETRDTNNWMAYTQGELRRRFGVLLGTRLPRRDKPDARTSRHLELLSHHYAGALGVAEGMMSHPEGYSAGPVGAYLDRARELMPSDATRQHRARYFYLRGALRLDLRDRAGGMQDLQTAIGLWPSKSNPALPVLEDLYRATGDEPALTALRARVAPRR